MNGFTLIERPNVSILNTLYANKYLWREDQIKLYNYKNLLNEQNQVSINYKQNLFNDKPYGRFYPISQTGSTYMWNKVRSSLFAETNYDCDIQNAHYTILENLYSRNHTNSNHIIPTIHNYNLNRLDIINEFKLSDEFIQSYNEYTQNNYDKKDFVKALFTIILYGGSVKAWTDEFKITDEFLDTQFIDKYIKPLKKEINEVTIYLTSRPKYEDMINDIKIQKDTDKQKHHKGTYLSYILQEEEVKIIKFAMDYIKKEINDFNVISYNYDGFQLEHKSRIKNKETDVRINDIISIIEYKIKEVFNYNIKFINKPFKTGFNKDELKEIDINVLNLLPFLENINQQTLADFLFPYIENKVVVVKGDIYYYTDKFWTITDKSFIMGIIEKDIYEYIKNNCSYYIPSCKNKKDIIKKVIKFVGTGSNIQQAFIKALNKLNKIHIIFDNKPNLLNAQNGTYDFDEKLIKPHNPNDYITKIINYNIDQKLITEQNNDKAIDFVKTWFETGISDDEVREITNYLLYYFGKSLHGINWIEKAIVLLGKLSRNGKSTFMDILRKILNNYMGSLDLSYFTEYDKHPEGAKPALLDIRGCRIIEVNEGSGDTGDDKSSPKIIPRQFKTLVGNDILKARSLYSSNVITFKSQGILVFPCNFNLQFKREGSDTSNKLSYFLWDVMFGDENEKGWCSKKPNCKDIDNNFKYKITDDIHITILHSLLYLQRMDYKPPELFRKWNIEKISELDSVGSWCDEFLVEDKTKFSYDNKYDKKLIEIFGDKLIGKDRVITLDYLFDRYSKDIENGVNKKVFNSRISVIYMNIYDSKSKTKIFGGQKLYLKKIRYNGFHDDEDKEEDIVEDY
jgi:phage/plasmid-associated DNA primase